MTTSGSDQYIASKEFCEKFAIRTPTWDWQANALSTIAETLMRQHTQPFSAFVQFESRARRRGCMPLNRSNFERCFNQTDEILALRLRKWQWKALHNIVDDDGDGCLKENDVVTFLQKYAGISIVDKLESSDNLALSSAEAFRQADRNCDGLLDRGEFEAAFRLKHGNATSNDIDKIWAASSVADQMGIEVFSKCMHAAPLQNSWQLAAMEQICSLLASKRDTVISTFQSAAGSNNLANNAGSETVLAQKEFCQALVKLGVALPTSRLEELHRCIDHNQSGAVLLGDIRKFPSVLLLQFFSDGCHAHVCSQLGSWLAQCCKLRSHEPLLGCKVGKASSWQYRELIFMDLCQDETRATVDDARAGF